MSAIITHRFRKNNVQNIFDEMTRAKVMIANCTSSGNTITTSAIPANLQTGMAIQITSGTGKLSTSTTTIVTSISSTTQFVIDPVPDTSLSSALLSFFSQYYIGIGKSDPYNSIDGSDVTPGSPVACRRTEVDTLNNLIAMQKVSVALNTGSSASQTAIYGNAGYVLPRYNWATNTYFKAWDPTDPSCLYSTTVANGTGQYVVYPCYATYNSGSGTKVYICTATGYESATMAATLTPPSTNASTIGAVGSASSDGYRWSYVSDLGLDTAQTLTAQNLTTTSGNTTSTLDSNQFFKVYRRATTIGTSSTITAAYTTSAGAIYSARVVSGGSGYSSASNFTIDGDGTTTASGVVTKIDAFGAIQTVSITTSGGGYTTGAIRFTSGPSAQAGAVILPRISPINGFGYDNVSDLPAWYAGFYANFSYDTVYPGTADVPSTDQIRQISLIRNPIVSVSSSGSPITYRCLKSLTLSTNSGAWIPSPGDVLEATSGVSSGARAYVDYTSTSGASLIVYYHQNSSTFGSSNLNITPIPFSSGSTFKTYARSSTPAYNTVVSTTSTITATASSQEYVAGTGEVIFVQNRVPITQAAGQSESITIVTQF